MRQKLFSREPKIDLVAEVVRRKNPLKIGVKIAASVKLLIGNNKRRHYRTRLTEDLSYLSPQEENYSFIDKISTTA